MMVAAPITVELTGRLGAFDLDVAFELPPTGITALFGPSGCGKTTILRCMAGLQSLPGRICIGGEVWQDSAAGIFIPPYRRQVGYVFQEASLFPHLSVRDNLLYGARRAAAMAPLRQLEFEDVVGLLGIRHLVDRSPMHLSGGERQRVAVGRALLSGPRVLMMDEPLSALDRVTKEDILPYFEMLHEALAIPIVYVSHDLAEVERLADTLVLLKEGRLVASGPLKQLQTNPQLSLVSAPEAAVVVEGRVTRLDQAFTLTHLAIDGGELITPGLHGEVGSIRRLRIAASDVSVALSVPADSTILNCIPARIVTIGQASGDPQVHVIMAVGGAGCRIVARITRRSLAALELRAGMDVFAQIKSVSLVAARTGRTKRSEVDG
jgi:molybdate transport system ATP-binding protein